jgi:cob(I)alamin adenosyltransferase
MKIYTKTGDDGTTGLFNGARVKKSDLRVECYGTVDELNSILGICIAYNPSQDLKESLIQISNMLFNLGSDLATPLHPEPKFKVIRIEAKYVSFLEALIDEYTTQLEELKNFILPGGCMVASFLHQARTVCRRAERRAVELQSLEEINPNTVLFLNRLSDYLFTASRYANFKSSINDNIWNPNIL